MTSNEVIERLGPPSGVCKHGPEQTTGSSSDSNPSYMTLCYSTPLDWTEHKTPLYDAKYIFENDMLTEFTFGHPCP
jgi:hypothetical protein